MYDFIDLSKWNNADISKVKGNTKGIICRIGFRGYGSGKIEADTKGIEYAKMCEKLGISYGVYFFTQAITPQEVLEEVAWSEKVINEIGRNNFFLGLWVDSEDSNEKRNGRADNLPITKRTDLLSLWCDTGNDRQMCGYYCSESWNKNKVVRKILEKYPLWCAKYSTKQPDFPNLCYWQFTSKGTIKGVAGSVDGNKSFIQIPMREVTAVEKPKIEPVKPITNIPSLKGYKGFSLDAGLKQFGYQYGFNVRKKYAELIGIKNYKGTVKQNNAMLNYFKTH